MDKLAETVGVEPHETRTKFPPKSIAIPRWTTETASDGPSTAPAFLELKERVSPALDRIAQARREHDLSVTLLISVYSNYADNPENYIPADYIPFLVDLNAEVRFDLQKGWLRYFKGKLCHDLSVLFRSVKGICK